MATRKKPVVPTRGPEDPAEPDKEVDVETTRNMNVDTDVERVDSDAEPTLDSQETADPATPRGDVESDRPSNTGDVER